MCIFQRLALAGVALAGLAGLAFQSGWLVWPISFLWLGSASIGAGLAMRHVWLQNLPEDLVPACGPGLDYMMESFPLVEVLAFVIQGDGNCAEVQWTFAGLSIPMLSLLLFASLLILGMFWLYVHAIRRS